MSLSFPALLSSFRCTRSTTRCPRVTLLGIVSPTAASPVTSRFTSSTSPGRAGRRRHRPGRSPRGLPGPGAQCVAAHRQRGRDAGADGKITTVPQFAMSLLNTLQNWADSMQTQVPGYRGRIVAVNHTKKEGGMNLDWGPPSSAPSLPAASMPERQRMASISTTTGGCVSAGSCRPSNRSSSLRVRS